MYVCMYVHMYIYMYYIAVVFALFVSSVSDSGIEIWDCLGLSDCSIWHGDVNE
jgi:hypothetical protein